MKTVHTVDAARLGIMLNELRLPTIKTLWPQFAERAHRRIERHLAEVHLPPGKTLPSFAFDAVPMVSKA